MGPSGIQEVGQTIMQNSQYAVQEINKIQSVKGSLFESPFFKEFIVDFNKTGKTIEEINQGLLECKVFGGKDLSKEYPELGQTALFCVTEIHTKEDIDYLAASLKGVLEK